MRVKCISLWEPWAMLVAIGAKRIETRSWRCPLLPGSLLAIHAAKKWDADLCRVCLVEPFRSCLDPERKLVWNSRVCPLPTGAVVCVVRLGECLSIVAKPRAGEKCVGLDDEQTLRVWHPFTLAGQQGHSGDGHLQLAEHESSFGNYNPGRFAWLFDEALAIDPVPERGRQSIWDWEVPEVLHEALAKLEAGR